MKRDIENRQDIDALMNVFYGRALSDDVIGYIFTDVARLDLEHHLPIIGDFWETLLFQTGNYPRHGRNPLQVHADLYEKEQLNIDHFNRWLEIFVSSVDELYSGERADYIKLRARAIAHRFHSYLAMAV